MPIKPENKALYPVNWKAISRAIRERAQYRCECEGECGLHPPVLVKSTNVGFCDGTLVPRRCTEMHGQPAKWAKGKVVLTVAHLNHDPRDCRRENLKAMCQRCHLRYDHDLHQRNSAETRAKKSVRALPEVPRGETA